jgi:hypothetical protein
LFQIICASGKTGIKIGQSHRESKIEKSKIDIDEMESQPVRSCKVWVSRNKKKCIGQLDRNANKRTPSNAFFDQFKVVQRHE